MPWPTSDELDDLVARFRARTLPKPEWTHLAHLAVGLWHVREHGPERALELLRTGITRLNAVLASPLAGKTALLRYYSKESLLSVSARQGWVEPDLEPLRLPDSTPAPGAD